MTCLGIKVTNAVDDMQFFGFNLPETFLRSEDINILKSLNLATEEGVKCECKNKNNPPFVQLVLDALLQLL
jgi:hypothetical protein